MENQFEERLRFFVDEFEKILNEYLGGLQLKPGVLNESVRYSLQVGGKRVRPALMFASAQMLGGKIADVSNFALALELIHTYSLIHDDLPAMDNDDFRRGKPSNHKVYGEANAVLAGDGLLNTAYSLCLDQCMKGEKFVLASKFLAECAGIFGMIAGQSADLYFSEKDRAVAEEDLAYIYEHKTGKLLLAPVAVASILSGNKFYFEFEQFGKYLGSLFQITDDILDVTGDFSTRFSKFCRRSRPRNPFPRTSFPTSVPTSTSFPSARTRRKTSSPPSVSTDWTARRYARICTRNTVIPFWTVSTATPPFCTI